MSGFVTGVGSAVSGADSIGDLLTADRSGAPVDAAARIGRKGLRYKDRATQLALCAADAALRDAGLWSDAGLAVPGGEVAVVVSSNFGNLDTVCRVAQSIGEVTSAGISAMDIPNASSNVTAAEVAIRYGLRGPNLTLCNGGTSGLDAVFWARTLLAAGRAEQVLVVGVEPDNEVVRRFAGRDLVLDGAVALVVEGAGAADNRGVRTRASLGLPVRAADTAGCVDRLTGAGAPPAMWLVPESTPDGLLNGVTRVNLWPTWGAASGAAGVLQCAAAVAWLDAGRPGPVYAVASGVEASAGIIIDAVRPPR